MHKELVVLLTVVDSVGCKAAMMIHQHRSLVCFANDVTHGRVPHDSSYVDVAIWRARTSLEELMVRHRLSVVRTAANIVQETEHRGTVVWNKLLLDVNDCLVAREVGVTSTNKVMWTSQAAGKLLGVDNMNAPALSCHNKLAACAVRELLLRTSR